MKQLLTLVVFIQCSLNATAQHVEKGYYVTLKGDTVQAELKVPNDLFGTIRLEVLESKVKTADSTTQDLKKLDPTDIKAYAFSYKGKDYIFSKKNLTAKTAKFFNNLQWVSLSVATIILGQAKQPYIRP